MKLEKLSTEQEIKMQEVKQYWLDYIFSCKNSLDREKAKISIDWLYKFSKLDSPVVVFMDSPMSCQYAAVYLKEFAKFLNKNPAQVGAQVGAQVRDQVGDQVWAQVWDQVWAQVGAQVGDQVWDQVRDQVGAQVGDQVRDQVGAQVGDQVRDQVRAQVGAQVWAQVGAQVRAQVGYQVRAQVGAQVWDQVWAQVRAQVGYQVRAQVGAQVWDQVWAQVGDQEIEFESFASYGSISDYYWISYFDFFTQIGVLNHKDFNDFKNIFSSGIYDMIQLNGFCIVCDMPNRIERNIENRLHSTKESAISFKDGYEQYFINGRAISKKNFDAIKEQKYTVQDFFNEPNEEVKSVCLQMMIELYGDNHLADFFKSVLKETDTYVDKKDSKFLKGTTGGMNIGVYTLFKGSLNNYDIAYCRVYCPSTDRMFYLGVEPKYNNAKDAIASLYPIPRKLKPHIKSISRQGERFSTTFTEKGLNLAKNLTKSETADLVNISGNEYFNLISYEY